ncbi:epigen [Mixophyes fleayi]|uniref:epigen n=1 Tax=Mixophyes fleayi TaxID=3061075 RepID=UPI003F4E3AA6
MALCFLFLLLTCAVMTVSSEEPTVTISPSTSTNENVFTKDKELKNITQEETACPGEYASFCINGDCVFHKAVDTPLCRCSSGFTGERCEHFILPATYGKEIEATYIAIGIGVGLLISGLIVFVLCYRQKRCKKSTQNYGMCNGEETL